MVLIYIIVDIKSLFVSRLEYSPATGFDLLNYKKKD